MDVSSCLKSLASRIGGSTAPHAIPVIVVVGFQ